MIGHPALSLKLLAMAAGGEDEEELDDDAIAGEAAAEDDAAGEVEDEGKGSAFSGQD